ncbi:AsmA-like C-terminal region-containing protein [Lutibacter maritimus]|uniref:AsmA-like C-terminal region n=1 Tax=Lutibacter maritimus TaxID=593133 RepID=A0A1I6R3T4_9FLAO|nr:AsmA-like C-terminal region-containing protein [Lutibacter maritimus]SFS59402.1 AsmA-like C-terminal region [Lutibacter maritimus]
MNYKKIAKITAVVLVLFVALLAAAPFLLKGKIKNAVLTAINDNVNANVDFNDVDLSLFKSFPSAALTISDFKITTNAPFEKDTLTFIKELHLNMPITALFKSNSESIQITDIKFGDAYVNLISNKEGKTNYDIMKPSDAKDKNKKDAINFAVKSYEITNSHIKYKDEAANISLELKEFNHSGSGDLSTEKSKLDTKSSAKLSFQFDKIKYFEDNELSLDAIIGIDLKTNTYSFLENEANISGLPLIFDGNVIMLDEGQQIDINFKTPTSSFKNFLAVMPKEYAKNLDNVKTEGDFTVIGVIKGMNNDDRIPNFDINIASNNASFKYPDLPKSVENIIIKALIKNETGIIADTYVNLDALNFRIDQDKFESNGTIKNLTTNPLVNAKLKGTINLANISQAYPFKLEQQLAGILKMDIATNFDMEAVEKNNYARIKSSGSMALSNFVYKGEEFKNEFNIKSTAVNFTPQAIVLKEFIASTGKTDMNATGTIQDVIGFVVSNKPLKGNFNLTSNTFSVNDFMSDASAINTETTSTSKAALKIPAFLDCTISASAKTVLYDNLELQNLKGKMYINDEKVTLENVTSSIFGGNIALSGNVSTKENTPTFAMDIGMNTFNIAQSFNKMEVLNALAPIAKIIGGTLNSTLKFSGNLNEDLIPNLGTISGNALAEIQTENIDAKTSPLLNTLASQLKFIDLSKLDLNNIKAFVSFENGKVNVKPFTIKYKDIEINISGSHGFDKTMDYKATFMVPAKYLGAEITSLMAKMSSEDVSKLIVPVTANIGGNFTNPSITTDYKSSVTNLTKQLVDVNKLKGKGTDILSGLLKVPSTNETDTVKNTTTPKVDVTKPKVVVDSLVKNKLKDFLSGNKKKKDTVN